jgi:integrase
VSVSRSVNSQALSGLGMPGLYLKGNVFYYQGEQRNGVRTKAFSLKTKDLSEAIILAADLRRSGFTSSEDGGFVDDLRMDDLIPIYCADRLAAKVFTLKSKVNAEVMLGGVSKRWNNPSVSHITVDKIRKYQADLHQSKSRRGTDFSEATVSAYVMRLKGFLSWCVERRHIRHSPMAGVKMPRPKKTKITEFASIEERNALLGTACREDIEVILHLGFYAGLRYGEMTAVRWYDLIKMADGQHAIKIQAHGWFTPKGKQARLVPIPTMLMNYLNGIRRPKVKLTDYILSPDIAWEQKHAKGYRTNPKRGFAAHAKKCGITWHITYHHLRHSYVTHHLSRGTSIALIAQWTGDTESVIVSNYAGFYPSAASVNAIE